ncbi:unnamed protein product [Vitrella brassicaformis CCMP3155]|uniref:Uncharacterized protein n=1 Tax=Vitrella brassicaformis (strain CCMP3155) TaxID=1169540 RepID=A0A0G4EUM9_VITBC|nr:unnamed protein product [Vitrella brassicaformis CCMP3155]|eukprot:CEM01943.1 unnamed protein product [Vitrella brassicaformis CCMP3155]
METRCFFRKSRYCVGTLSRHEMDRRSALKDVTCERERAIEDIYGPINQRTVWRAVAVFDRHAALEVRCPFSDWEFLEDTALHPFGQIWHLIDASYTGDDTIVTDGFRTDWLLHVDDDFFGWRTGPAVAWSRETGLGYCGCLEHDPKKDGALLWLHVPTNPFVPGVVVPTDA